MPIKGVYGDNILILDNIFEIVGNYNFGHLIFDSESTFYFIPQLKDTVLGKYKLDSISTIRQPILKFYDEWNPKRFILFIDNYKKVNKVAFFPDFGILIQDYKQQEDSMISDMLKAEKIKIHLNTNIDWVKYLLIFSNVLFAILFIFLIIKKRRLKK